MSAAEELEVCQKFVKRVVSRAESVPQWTDDNRKVSIILSSLWQELDTMELTAKAEVEKAAAAKPEG